MNARQIEVLMWISEGCPDGLMDGFAYETTAVALMSRGLVTVDRRSGRWSADITEVGRHYLEHGTYPDGFWPSTPARRSVRPSPDRAPSEPRRDRPTKASPWQPAGERLVREVQAAGGILEVEPRPGIDWRARVHSAIRLGRVPDGMMLSIRGVLGSSSRLAIVLEDQPEPIIPVPEPLVVPSRVTRPHPVLAELHRLERPVVTRQVEARVRRLLNALATAASARGYTVSAVDPWDRSAGPWADGVLTVQVNNHLFGVDLVQKRDRSEHIPSATELRNKERYGYLRIPKYDSLPGERLTLKVTNGFPHRQSSWSDDARQSLDDVLAEVLQEIELRANSAEQARLEQERRRLVDLPRWEAAMDRARVEFAYSYRAEVLMGQVRAWHLSQDLSEYIDAMKAAASELPDDTTKAAAEAWISWATQRRDDIDPLRSPLAIPEPPEPKPHELEPFLGGLSPWGPSQAGG